MTARADLCRPLRRQGGSDRLSRQFVHVRQGHDAGAMAGQIRQISARRPVL